MKTSFSSGRNCVFIGNRLYQGLRLCRCCVRDQALLSMKAHSSVVLSGSARYRRLTQGLKALCLIDKQIGNDKHGENNGRYAIGGHKGDVDAAQVVGLYDGMLVNKHGNEHQHPYPV
jgi:hypothetical protein